MPVHDWSVAEPRVFHDFQQRWLEVIRRDLNQGLLPVGYYAVAEPIALPVGSDVLKLLGGNSEREIYARKAQTVAVRHLRENRLVARIEVVSPGNKSGGPALEAFLKQARDLLNAGVHLLIVDLFLPDQLDPRGIHPLIWTETDEEFEFNERRPLACLSYIGGDYRQAFVEAFAIGDDLPDMPVFLTEEVEVPLPLENAYRTAWEGVPAHWQRALVAGLKW